MAHAAATNTVRYIHTYVESMYFCTAFFLPHTRLNHLHHIIDEDTRVSYVIGNLFVTHIMTIYGGG